MTALVPTLHRMVESLGLRNLLGPGDMEAGLAHIQALLADVAAEAARAETEGVPLSSAAEDAARFPLLHRLHNGVLDLLTMTLPDELVDWLRGLLDGDEAIADEIERSLGHLAADPEAAPLARTLARVLLFHGVRIELAVAEHLSGSSIATVGAVPEDIDHIAEAQVARWVDEAARDLAAEGAPLSAPLLAPDVRPLHVLAAAAMVQLDDHVSRLRAAIARLDEDTVTTLRMRGELEKRLRDLDAADAVLLRNAFAPAVGEPRVTVEELRDTHPLLFGGKHRDAIDQQVSRLRRKLERGNLPERRGESLIDVIKDAKER